MFVSWSFKLLITGINMPDWCWQRYNLCWRVAAIASNITITIAATSGFLYIRNNTTFQSLNQWTWQHTHAVFTRTAYAPPFPDFVWFSLVHSWDTNSWSGDEMWTWKQPYVYMQISEMNSAIAFFMLTNVIALFISISEMCRGASKSTSHPQTMNCNTPTKPVHTLCTN